MVPAAVTTLVKAGLEVIVESGAGAAAGYTDEAYAEKGARIRSSRAEVLDTADVVLQVRGLGANPEHGAADTVHVRKGQCWISTFEPLTAHEGAMDRLIDEIEGLADVSEVRNEIVVGVVYHEWNV